MILLIDTTRPDGFIIVLVKKNKPVATGSVRTQYAHGEKLLPAITRLLKSKKLTPQKLSGLIVVAGPGRFSVVRAGVVVANTLAASAGVKVVGVTSDSLGDVIKRGLGLLRKQKQHSLVLPHYGQEPHITMKK